MKLFYNSYEDLINDAKSQGHHVASPVNNMRTVVIGGLSVGYKLWVYEREASGISWHGHEINLEKE